MKQNVVKRVLALGSALCLALGAGAGMADGAANFNETGMPIVNERVVQTMTFSSDPVYTVDLNQDMYFFKEMVAGSMERAQESHVCSQ